MAMLHLAIRKDGGLPGRHSRGGPSIEPRRAGCRAEPSLNCFPGRGAVLRGKVGQAKVRLGGQAPADVVATVLRHLDKASLQKHREAIRKDLGEKAPLGDEVLRGLLWERLKDSHDLTKLPVPLREFALETERRRSQALARPWWKRGIPTSARNSLKRAVARHAAAGQSNDELLRLIANDARVGQEARDARGGLSKKTVSYVSGLADHGGRG